MQTVLVEKKANDGEFYGAVTSDIKSSLIQFVSERGWGKSTALKNIVKRCMEKDSNIQFYAFDTCFDEETEILTRGGWVFFKNLKGNEFVATLNKTNEIEYQQIQERIVSITDKLYHYNGRSLNFVTSQNHKFIIDKRYRRQLTGIDIFKREVFTTKQLHESKTGNRYYIPKTGKWVGENKDFFILPPYKTPLTSKQHSGHVKRKEVLIPMSAWLSFLGLYLSEGCVTGKNKYGVYSVVGIDQSLNKMENIYKIRKCLNDSGLKFSEYPYTGSLGTKMISFRIYNIQLVEYLKQFGKARNKYIPREVFDLPPEQLRFLFDGLMLGYGCYGKANKITYSTISRQLADDFQELIFKLGMVGNLHKKLNGMYDIHILRNKRGMINKENFKIEYRLKPIYCVLVPNHTIYTRRHGTPMWSMNSQSWYKKAPLKYRQLVTREKIKTGQVANIPDCVYEIGSLSEAERRIFLGIIIKQHYEKRYQLSLSDPEAFNRLPWCVYILEEANVYFGSFSLRMKDWVTPVLQDFVSVGRNYKMSAFLVATAEQGEISPSLRRRSRRIYGKLVAEGDIAIVRRTDKAMAEYLAKDIPRFNFIYWGESFIGPIHVQDTVTEMPVDYIMQTPPIKSTIGSWWLVQLLIGAFFMAALIYFFIS